MSQIETKIEFRGNLSRKLAKDAIRLGRDGISIAFCYLDRLWALTPRDGEYVLREIDDHLDESSKFDRVIMKEVVPDDVLGHIENFVLESVLNV